MQREDPLFEKLWDICVKLQFFCIFFALNAICNLQ